MQNAASVIVIIVVLVLAVAVLVKMIRLEHTVERLNPLRGRVYRLPDPERSVLLDTPIGRFYIVRDYMETGPKIRKPIIYIYLPEDFGFSKEVLREFSNMLIKETERKYDLSAVPKGDESGADAYIYYAGISTHAPASDEMLRDVAKILQQNIIHPKGVTTLAKAER